MNMEMVSMFILHEASPCICSYVIFEMSSKVTQYFPENNIVWIKNVKLLYSHHFPLVNMSVCWIEHTCRSIEVRNVALPPLLWLLCPS